MNGDNMENVRCESNRILSLKEREYLKDRFNELKTYKMKILDTCMEA
jgi:hypothetical protein